MPDNSTKDTVLSKIFVGVAIATIPAIILYYIGINKSKNANTPETSTQSREYPAKEEIDYNDYVGVYTGTTVNSVDFSVKGSTVLVIKDIDILAKKVKVEVQWGNGLSGEGRLNGNVEGNRAELQGTIFSNITGWWDIDMTINFIDSKTIKGTYQLSPLVGNLNGAQNGKFELEKEM